MVIPVLFPYRPLKWSRSPGNDHVYARPHQLQTPNSQNMPERRLRPDGLRGPSLRGPKKCSSRMDPFSFRLRNGFRLERFANAQIRGKSGNTRFGIALVLKRNRRSDWRRVFPFGV